MRVECIRAFVAQHEGRSYAYAEGDILNLPAGADWLTAGFVQEIAQTLPEADSVSVQAEDVVQVQDDAPQPKHRAARRGH